MEVSLSFSFVFGYLLLTLNIMTDGPNCVNQPVLINRPALKANDDIFLEECTRRQKIYFDGDCYSLLTKASCAEGQWLVLSTTEPSSTTTTTNNNNNINKNNNNNNNNNIENDNYSIGLKATCAIKRCNNNYAYWPETDTCVLSTDNGRCREPGTTSVTNYFGEGTCDCLENPPHVRIRSCDGIVGYGCYPLYSSGPCGGSCIVKETEYGFGECSPNVCVVPGEPDDSWLFRSEDGYCYRQNSTGPCETHERFAVHPRTRKPDCVDDLTESNLVGGIPSICQTDYDDQCADGEDDQVAVDKSVMTDYFKRKVIRDALFAREKATTTDRNDDGER